MPGKNSSGRVHYYIDPGYDQLFGLVKKTTGWVWVFGVLNMDPKYLAVTFLNLRKIKNKDNMALWARILLSKVDHVDEMIKIRMFGNSI